MGTNAILSRLIFRLARLISLCDLWPSKISRNSSSNGTHSSIPHSSFTESAIIIEVLANLQMEGDIRSRTVPYGWLSLLGGRQAATIGCLRRFKISWNLSTSSGFRWPRPASNGLVRGSLPRLPGFPWKRPVVICALCFPAHRLAPQGSFQTPNRSRQVPVLSGYWLGRELRLARRIRQRHRADRTSRRSTAVAPALALSDPQRELISAVRHWARSQQQRDRRAVAYLLAGRLLRKTARYQKGKGHQQRAQHCVVSCKIPEYLTTWISPKCFQDVLGAFFIWENSQHSLMGLAAIIVLSAWCHPRLEWPRFSRSSHCGFRMTSFPRTQPLQFYEWLAPS